MRTIAALALVAAAANADDVLNQALCSGYLWGLSLDGWTCTEDADTAKAWTCENTDSSLASTTVDSTSAAWQLVCVNDAGTAINPVMPVGTADKCDAWTQLKIDADANWVISDADKETFDWAFACAGLDGASALTALGAAVVAAVAALAF